MSKPHRQNPKTLLAKVKGQQRIADSTQRKPRTHHGKAKRKKGKSSRTLDHEPELPTEPITEP